MKYIFYSEFNIYKKIFILFIFLFSSCAVCMAHRQEYSSFVLKEWVSKDARLQKTVSVSTPQITLYELLSFLTYQTAVKLEIDPKDTYSTTLLTLELKDKPLLEVMNGLSSLLMLKQAPWYWIVTKKSGVASYKFQPSSAFRNSPEKLKKEMHEKFLKKVAIWTNFSLLPDADRTTHKSDISAIISPKYLNSYVNSLPATNEYWEDVRLFANGLSESERDRVLNGEKIDVSLSKISSDAQSRLYKHVASGGNSENADRLPFTVSFQARQKLFGAKDILTILWMIATSGTSSFNTTISVPDPGDGQTDITKKWLFEGDARNNAEIENQPVEPIAPTKSFEEAPMLERILSSVGVGSKKGIMAVVNAWDSFSFSEEGKTWPERLKTITSNYAYKFRNGMVLFMHTPWFYGDDGLFPYEVLSDFKVLDAKAPSQLSFKNLAPIFDKLSIDQLKRLGSLTKYGNAFVDLSPFLSIYHDNPKVISVDGIPLDEQILSLLPEYAVVQLKSLLAQLKVQKLDSGLLTHRRIHIKESHFKNDSEIMLQVYAVKQWMSVIGTRLEKREPRLSSTKIPE